jgi:hypothetical protein
MTIEQLEKTAMYDVGLLEHEEAILLLSELFEEDHLITPQKIRERLLGEEEL